MHYLYDEKNFLLIAFKNLSLIENFFYLLFVHVFTLP